MKKTRVPALTTEQVAEAKRLSIAMNVDQLAAHYNKSRACIYRALATPINYIAPKNANQKYTDKQKAEMIDKVRNGTHTRLEITQEYGISFSLLCTLLQKAGVKSTSPNIHKHKPKNITNRHVNLEARYSGLADGMF